MSKKFHVNDEGDTGVCKAQNDGCPFGGPADHHESAEAARAAYEIRNASFGSVLTKARQQEQNLRKRFIEALAVVEEMGIDPSGEDGYSPEQVQDFLAEAERYDVTDAELAEWLRTSDSQGAALLSVYDFTRETGHPVAVPGEELMSTDQVAHRVGPYFVSTRTVQSIGAKPGTFDTFYETVVINETAGDYELPSYEVASREAKDGPVQHADAIARAQRLVRGES